MKLARLLVPAAALALVAGCANPGGNVAFQVGDTQVSIKAVDQAVTDCAKITGYAADDIRTQVADWLLRGSVAKAVEQSKGITVTDKDIQDVIAANTGASELNVGKCGDALRGLLEAQLVAKKGGKSLTALAQGIDIQVNPIYGSYDRSTMSFVGNSGSLSYDGNGPTSIGG